MSVKGISRSCRARLEVRDAECAANNTNDVTYVYGVKVAIRPDVFLVSSVRPAINYVVSLFNIFQCTDPMYACGYRMYIG